MPLTFTTVLPDEDQPTLLNGVEDEITVDRGSTVTNYGSVRVQVRETDTGSADWATATGFDEAIVAYGTLQTTFIGLEDGEEYEVRARTETEHVTGAWTAPVSIVTVFPGATSLFVASSPSGSVTLEWTDNADNEDGTEIWRREELDPRRDTGFGPWEQVGDRSPTAGTGQAQYTDGAVEPNHDYEYYVIPYTEHSSAQSPTVAATTDVAVPSEGWYIVLEDPAGERATVPHDLIDESRPRLKPETSAVGRWRVDVVPNDVLRDWLRSEALIYHDGSLWFRGPFTRYAPRGGSGPAASMEGLDVIQHLKGGGQSFDVVSEPGYEAFQRFVDTELPDWVANVTAPGADLIDDDFVVQDESDQAGLSSVFSTALADSTMPIKVEAGELQPVGTSLLSEGRGYSSTTGSNVFDGTAYSDGYAQGFLSSGTTTSGYIEWTVTTEHDIPEADVGLAVRDDDQGSGTVGITWYIDGSPVDYVDAGVGLSFSWTDIGDGSYNGTGWTGGTLLAGTHTLRVEVDTVGTSNTYAVDCLTLYDKRYYPDANLWDTEGWDSVHQANGYLDGPPTYRPIDAAADTFSQEYNVSSATITVGMSNVTGGQRAQATNDGGTTWLPNDGTEAGTTTVTADFSAAGTFGTNVQGRVTLDGYGTRDTGSPRLGYLPQTAASWKLTIDTNALRVIDDQTYSGSPYDILDAIASDSGMVFVPDYRDGQLAMEAFAPGDVVGTANWTVEDSDPVDTTEGYYNRVTVLGPEENGTRMTATATSQAEVDKHGVVEGPAEFRPDAKTQAELTSIARTVLSNGITRDTITGTLEVSSQFAQPGYAYEVPEFAELDPRTNPVYVLRSAEFEWGTMRLDFEGRSSLARAIRSIETEVRTTKRAL